MKIRTDHLLALDLIAFVGLLATWVPWQTRFLALYFAARLLWTTTHRFGAEAEARGGPSGQ